MGLKIFVGSVLECGVRVGTVVSFDEEKPLVVQCKVELESTVASLRHILISPGVLDGGSPGQAGGGPGGPECRECGRGSSLSVDYGLSQAHNTLSLFWDDWPLPPKVKGEDVYWGKWAYD